MVWTDDTCNNVCSCIWAKQEKRLVRKIWEAAFQRKNFRSSAANQHELPGRGIIPLQSWLFLCFFSRALWCCCCHGFSRMSAVPRKTAHKRAKCVGKTSDKTQTQTSGNKKIVTTQRAALPTGWPVRYWCKTQLSFMAKVSLCFSWEPLILDERGEGKAETTFV